jgi:hypothetical protein
MRLCENKFLEEYVAEGLITNKWQSEFEPKPLTQS